MYHSAGQGISLLTAFILRSSAHAPLVSPIPRCLLIVAAESIIPTSPDCHQEAVLHFSRSVPPPEITALSSSRAILGLP
jgi:hypothetical protein